VTELAGTRGQLAPKIIKQQKLMFNAPLPWQPYHGGHVGNMMGCHQPSFVEIGPLGGKLWHFQYFATWRPSAIFEF